MVTDSRIVRADVSSVLRRLPAITGNSANNQSSSGGDKDSMIIAASANNNNG